MYFSLGTFGDQGPMLWFPRIAKKIGEKIGIFDAKHC
jgi:hypothetical protein